MSSKYTMRAARVRTNRALFWLNSIKHSRNGVTLYGWKHDNMVGYYGRVSSL